MRTKMKTEKGYQGFEYVTATFPVTVHPKLGDLVSGEVTDRLDKALAAEIIKRRIPLRGKELKFLRKKSGMSLAAMGFAIGLSSTAIMKWEQAVTKRLDPINEVGARAWFAQIMKANVPGWFDELKGVETAVEVAIKVA